MASDLSECPLGLTRATVVLVGGQAQTCLRTQDPLCSLQPKSLGSPCHQGSMCKDMLSGPWPPPSSWPVSTCSGHPSRATSYVQ